MGKKKQQNKIIRIQFKKGPPAKKVKPPRRKNAKPKRKETKKVFPRLLVVAVEDKAVR